MSRDYTHELIALQPPGKALPTDPDSNWVKLLDALAQELSRVDGRVGDLVDEITVADDANEMLPDWERVLGLPDPCAPAPTDPAIRRARIRAKLSSVGGQSRAYFLSVLAQLGVTVTIDELHGFRMGLNGMGDGVGGGEWANTWQINVPGTLDADTQALLKCVINQLKPAHTAVLWSVNGQAPETNIAYNGQIHYDAQVTYGSYL
jgi:uncharacterized protein YmfQ (DUF2313 family)